MQQLAPLLWCSLRPRYGFQERPSSVSASFMPTMWQQFRCALGWVVIGSMPWSCPRLRQGFPGGSLGRCFRSVSRIFSLIVWMHFKILLFFFCAPEQGICDQAPQQCPSPLPFAALGVECLHLSCFVCDLCLPCTGVHSVLGLSSR